MIGWMAEGACRDTDPNIFFPDAGDDIAIALATTICHSCLVRPACLDYARHNKIRDGIWGGVFLERPSRRRHIRRCSRCGSTHLMRFQGHLECTDCSFSWAG